MSNTRQIYLTEFCFCLPLEIGGYIIAFLNILLVPVALYLAVDVIMYNDEAFKWNAELGDEGNLAIAIIEIILVVVIFFSAILILIGTWQRISKCFHPWLITFVLYTFYLSIWVIIQIATVDWGQIIYLLICFEFCHIWLVIYSLYRQIQEAEEMHEY